MLESEKQSLFKRVVQRVERFGRNSPSASVLGRLPDAAHFAPDAGLRKSANPEENMHRLVAGFCQLHKDYVLAINIIRKKYGSERKFLEKCVSCKLHRTSKPVRIIMNAIACDLEEHYTRNHWFYDVVGGRSQREAAKRGGKPSGKEEEVVEPVKLMGLFDSEPESEPPAGRQDKKATDNNLSDPEEDSRDYLNREHDCMRHSPNRNWPDDQGGPRGKGWNKSGPGHGHGNGHSNGLYPGQNYGQGWNRERNYDPRNPNRRDRERGRGPYRDQYRDQYREPYRDQYRDQYRERPGNYSNARPYYREKQHERQLEEFPIKEKPGAGSVHRESEGTGGSVRESFKMVSKKNSVNAGPHRTNLDFAELGIMLGSPKLEEPTSLSNATPPQTRTTPPEIEREHVPVPEPPKNASQEVPKTPPKDIPKAHQKMDPQSDPREEPAPVPQPEPKVLSPPQSSPNLAPSTPPALIGGSSKDSPQAREAEGGEGKSHPMAADPTPTLPTVQAAPAGPKEKAAPPKPDPSKVKRPKLTTKDGQPATKSAKIPVPERAKRWADESPEIQIHSQPQNFNAPPPPHNLPPLPPLHDSPPSQPSRPAPRPSSPPLQPPQPFSAGPSLKSLRRLKMKEKSERLETKLFEPQQPGQPRKKWGDADEEPATETVSSVVDTVADKTEGIASNKDKITPDSETEDPFNRYVAKIRNSYPEFEEREKPLVERPHRYSGGRHRGKGRLKSWEPVDQFGMTQMGYTPEDARRMSMMLAPHKHSNCFSKLINHRFPHSLVVFKDKQARMSKFLEKEFPPIGPPNSSWSEAIFFDALSFEICTVVSKLTHYCGRFSVPRTMIRDRLNHLLQKSLGNKLIYLQEFGSVATGLLTPFSDLDLAIRNSNSHAREHMALILEVFSGELSKHPFVLSQKTIATATIPVIKLQADSSLPMEDFRTSHLPFKIKTDIIVEQFEPFEINSTPFRTTEFTKWCIDTYPTFLEVVLLLKFTLACHSLSNSYTGDLTRRPQRVLPRTPLPRLPPQRVGPRRLWRRPALLQVPGVPGQGVRPHQNVRRRHAAERVT